MTQTRRRTTSRVVVKLFADEESERSFPMICLIIFLLAQKALVHEIELFPTSGLNGTALREDDYSHFTETKNPSVC